MLRIFPLSLSAVLAFVACGADTWPDGSPISPWFGESKHVDVAALGKAYRFDDNFIFPDGETHTREIQALIDRVADEGGGVITVTPGVYRSGSLFFRPKVHLRLLEGAVLLGSDNPLDYPIVDTRIEGKNRKFVAAPRGGAAFARARRVGAHQNNLSAAAAVRRRTRATNQRWERRFTT